MSDPTFIDRYKLIRISIVIFTCVMYYLVSYWSFDFAKFCIINKVPASDAVLMIGPLQVLMTALLGYCFKIYSRILGDVEINNKSDS